MNSSTLDDLRPRTRDRLSRGALFAIVAHVGLLIALSLGVSWKTSEPEGVEAELWAAVPQIAAPRAVEPEPRPAPAPEPPTPAPTPTPRVETPPPPSRDAEIAQQKRDEKERLEKQRLEDEKREQAEKAAEEARSEADAKKVQAQKKQADLEKQKKREEQLARLSQQAREDQLKRMQGQMDATGAPGSTGTAAQSAGPSSSYAGRIVARVKPNITLTREVPGNPLASVEVRVAPDGTILGKRLVQSSGMPEWDEAVLRAIDKTAVLPRDENGKVYSPMTLDFRPGDL